MGWQAKAIAALIISAMLVAGYLSWRDHQREIGAKAEREKWIEVIREQKREAAAMLARETARVLEAEARLQTAKNNQEVADYEHQKKVVALSDQLGRIAAAHGGRLRDPNAGCGKGGGGANGAAASATGNSPGDGAEAGGLLSAELTELLQRLHKEADTINLAYASCRSNAFEVRAIMQQGEITHE